MFQKSLILVTLALATLSQGQAGTNISGGGDNPTLEHNSAWFLSERPIRYCQIVGPEFGVEEKEIASTVSKAFRTWQSYLKEWNIQGFAKAPLVFNHTALETCDGTEDLTFYFGVSTDQVEKVKKTYANPTAMAHRTHYDVATGWGKGFIWLAAKGKVNGFAPEWEKPGHLMGMLLHELGHVLGCEHMPGTIMREDLATYMTVEAEGELKHHRLTHIEGEKTLITLREHSTTEFKGTISFQEDLEFQRETFKRFTGKNPLGLISAHLQVRPKEALNRLVLILEDESSTYELPLANSKDASGVKLTGELFKSGVRQETDLGTFVLGSSYSNGASVAFTTLKALDGSEYMVTIEYNMSKVGPIQIKYILNNKRRDLFQTRFPGNSI